MQNGWQLLLIEKMPNNNSIIHPKAKIGLNVSFGNFCEIGPNVSIGDDCKIMNHVYITGNTTIGSKNIIYPFASIGSNPQDLKFKNEKTKLIIGNNNILREYVTINPGTEHGGGETKIGDGCLFMISSHIAHDCHVGNEVIVANNVPIAGHCNVGDHVIIGGNSAVQQFCSIGKGSMIGGMTGVNKSVLPFSLITGNRCYFENLNLIGLKRKGYETKIINEYKEIIKKYFYDKSNLDGIHFSQNPLVLELSFFLKKNTNKLICRPLNI
jgi:UDP-N-acetylglucosamine acyltransferase